MFSVSRSSGKVKGLGYAISRVRHAQPYVAVNKNKSGFGLDVGKPDGVGGAWGFLADSGMRIGLNLRSLNYSDCHCSDHHYSESHYSDCHYSDRH
jgi:hypothetical protein